MSVYTGSLDDSRALVKFIRDETAKLRSLRKLMISPAKTVVSDINKDSMEFPGLTYGAPALEVLMEELGLVFNAEHLHNPKATPSGVKEFDLSARHPWGEDRIL